MKILYVNSLDKRYGSTYRSRNIVKALVELGHDIQYVESNLEETIFSKSISIKQSDGIVGYFKATCIRTLIVLKLNYDILFLQKFTPLTITSLIVGKLKRKKCIVDWDDLDWALQGPIIKKILVFICEFFGPYLADKITTHSLLLKEYAEKRGIKNILIVNQVVDFDSIEVSEEDKNAIREKYNLQGKKVLGYLCTLTEGGARDIDVIIKWVSELIKRDSDFFLFIIGGGPLEDRIKKMFASCRLQSITNYVITGIIPHRDVYKFISVCDVGLVYMRDNLGNQMRVSFKVLEYLTLGIPVVGRLSGETKDRFSKFCYNINFEDDPIDKFSESLYMKNAICVNRLNFEEYSFKNIKNSLYSLVDK